MNPSAQTYYRPNPHRCGQRTLGAAEGVLVALRHCRLDQAFTDIVETAKRYNVAPMGLAEALVAVAENDATHDLDPALVAAVYGAWGALLDTTGHERALQPQPMTAACTSVGPPKFVGCQR